jgi:hypothetical protein
MTDPTDHSMFIESDYEVICFKKEWLRRGLENICGCPKCNPKVNDETNLAGLPNETMGVLRDDLAVDDEPSVS